MLIFGVDIPLVEVVLVMGIIIFFLLVEAIVIISLLIKQLNKTKKLSVLIEKLSETLLQIKKVEVQGLHRFKSRKK